MNVEEYNGFCASLPHSTHVVQWGGAHVWKIGGKVYAIAGWGDGKELAVTFKVSELAYEVLKDEPGLRPAPYLASRGMTWIQRTSGESMSDAGLKDHIHESYRIVGRKLPKKARLSLGFQD